jgi:hypothetical protein
MKLLLGLLVLAVGAFFIRKAVTKKNTPVKPVNSGGGTTGSGSGQGGTKPVSSGSGSGSGSGSSGFKGSKGFKGSGSGSGSGSGNGIGSGGSSDGIITNPGGPTIGSGTGSKGHKGAGLLDVDGNEIPFIKDDSPSNQIKDQLK